MVLELKLAWIQVPRGNSHQCLVIRLLLGLAAQRGERCPKTKGTGEPRHCSNCSKQSATNSDPRTVPVWVSIGERVKETHASVVATRAMADFLLPRDLLVLLHCQPSKRGGEIRAMHYVHPHDGDGAVLGTISDAVDAIEFSLRVAQNTSLEERSELWIVRLIGLVNITHNVEPSCANVPTNGYTMEQRALEILNRELVLREKWYSATHRVASAKGNPYLKFGVCRIP